MDVLILLTFNVQHYEISAPHVLELPWETLLHQVSITSIMCENIISIVAACSGGMTSVSEKR